MDKYYISTDKNKLDLNVIHDYLCNHSYWAKDRTFDTVKRSIDNSLCFGLYNKSDSLIGFARILTDFAVFAYIMDVFIIDDYKRQGLGKYLMDYIIRYPDLKDVHRIMLATKDAHSFYEKYGFKLTEHADKLMDKVKN
jgi:GNAT superfamily N-acetyltransferase